MRVMLMGLILLLSTPVFAEKIPHIMPAPYNLDRYWEAVQGELPKPVAQFLREFAEKGMPCKARGWSRTPVEGVPRYDSRVTNVTQEFYGWEELDRFQATHTFRVTFRWLLFQEDIVVRVARVDVTVKLTWSANEARLETFTGTITENGHVTNLMACCPVHD